MKDTVDFTAKLDGLMFDNLINGIYSNKMGAGIREYATNARDGHARRGNLDTPFDIGLPTRNNPIFEVRDYGSSLTHDEVFGIFTVLGESTKRDTNDETGCLGVGSKSAFAYTNTFNVTCWLNGEERNYVCYIGEHGKPKTSLLSTVKSKTEQGMRVSYAVKLEDVNSFNQEAIKQLRGFDPQPTVTRHTETYVPLDESRLMLQGDGWKIYTPEKGTYYGYNSGKPMALQGSVAYPIDISNQSLKTKLNSYDRPMRNQIEKLLGATDCIIKFNIGEISVTTNREELQYTDTTCDNILRKSEEVVNKVKTDLDKSYVNCKSLEEARKLYSRTAQTDTKSIDYVLGIDKRMWDGIILNKTMCMAEADGYIGEAKSNGSYYHYNADLQDKGKVEGELRLETDYHYQNNFGEIKATFNFRDKLNTNAKLRANPMVHKVGELIILVDSESDMKDKKTNEYMRTFWKGNMKGNHEFVWIKVKNKADAKTFLETVYHDDPSNVFYLDELTPTSMPKRTNSSGVVVKQNDFDRTLRVIRGQRYAAASDSNNYRKVDFLTNPSPLPAIYFKKNEFFWTKADMDNEENQVEYTELSRLINQWCDPNFVLFVINNNQLKFATDNPKFFKPGKEAMISNWKMNNKGWEQEIGSNGLKEEKELESQYGIKLSRLKEKSNVFIKALEPHLRKFKAGDNVSKKALSKPSCMDDWMKDEIALAKNKWSNIASATPFTDYIEKDEVLKYLVSQYQMYYGNYEDLVNAIKVHINNQHT